MGTVKKLSELKSGRARAMGVDCLYGDEVGLHIENVSHSFDDNHVLHNINLDIEAGQIVAIVGPSGCGKSTLLRGILGTHPFNRGIVAVNGPSRSVGTRYNVLYPGRDIGIVYQHYTLYDFLTAQQNVAFGPKLDQTTMLDRLCRPWFWWPLHREHMKTASQWLEKVGLGGMDKKYPAELSGGMRQRVAIAQALIMKPQLLLLDEPFGALDEATREELQLILLHFYQENLEAKQQGKYPPYTILIVTHELNEAIYVSDRVVGLSQYHAGNAADDGGYVKRVGATIVYDKEAPVFHPGDAKDYVKFTKQKEELRKAVFDETTCLHYEEYVSYWDNRKKLEAKEM